ncbi:hypothetical protein GCK32_003534 [Trichostrongylus colubriformis]|uniref:Uncharacterized protein n=1 Tax=Trichostrongylus colubriformis TaxID=6319 RepID=A0AAN8IHH7_TRICO
MNSNGSPNTTIAPTLDLQALLSSMPDFTKLPSMSNVPKHSSSTDIPTSQQSLLFPNDQLAALSLGLFPMNAFPMFSLLPMGPMASTVPPHSTIESLGLMTNNCLRQSTSTMGPPVLDSRPRAFSSAAALQRPKPTTTPEKRRKRSRKAQEEEQSSVLRMLVDEEDDVPIPIRQPPSMKDPDEKVRRDAAKASVLSASSSPRLAAKRTSPERLANLIEEPAMPLRRIIRDEDLPDSIGPDSPFRHHPKYQRRQPDADMMDGMDALMAFSTMNGHVAESSEPTPSPKNDSGYTSAGSPKKSFAEMMEHAICRELVTAE